MERIKTILDKVYGVYTAGQNWSPKPFVENKSRYLWTDAYGVVNFLTLYCETKEEQYLNQAEILIRTVHDTLGKNRDGKTRLGNATDDQPTLGGLRIGKPDDEGSSMSQDGQYYHYLVKWMFALNRASLVTKNPRYNDWAIQLAKAVHPHFVQRSSGNLRMFWKMSIDLKRPLVSSEGGLDPYSGYSVYKILQNWAHDKTNLTKEIAEMEEMVKTRYHNYHRTDDSLGAGSALSLCAWHRGEPWAEHMFGVASESVEHLWKSGALATSGNPRRRLAFREFGTTIGVQMHENLMTSGWKPRVDELHEFWFPRIYERDADITPVMFCTSLFPGLMDPSINFHELELTLLKSVGYTDKRMDRIKTIVEKVYGVYNTTSHYWSPKPFLENKSRYLWTDAYGVVNFLTLYCETKEERYLNQAKILIQTVHDTLGKNRDGKTRLGEATDDQPTLGGLRIGKPDKEGSSMSQDGQYYHYLTKWMFALNRASLVTKNPQYNNWAIELVKAVHPHFVQRSSGNLRMYWKMSIDLKRPLVNSEGGLDAYDGYSMYKILQDYAQDTSVLSKEIADMREMVEARYRRYDTDDCLDAGEALWLASWNRGETWAELVFKVASEAVEKLWRNGEFGGDSHHRLAFREFGTTIGVQMHENLMKHGWKSRVNELHEFWFPRVYERDTDISPVMFCTSLFPGLVDPSYQC